MFGSLVALVIFPYLQLSRGHITAKKSQDFLPTTFLATVQSTQLNILHLVSNSYFVVVFILLGWLGGKPAVEPYTTASL